MNQIDVKSILEKNARIFYSDRKSALEELESIADQVKSFHQGYELFRKGMLARLIGELDEALGLCERSLNHGYIHNDIIHHSRNFHVNGRHYPEPRHV